MIYPTSVVLGILFTFFLFWRACRHELLDSEESFDLIGVSILGAILFSRIFDFLFKNELTLSLTKFVFFNRFGGFDFYGGLFGIYVATYLFLKSKKLKQWFVLDLAAAPLAFGQTLFALGKLLALGSLNIKSLEFVYFISYFLLFIVIKRLEAKKRHLGFFASFYLLSIFALDMVLFRFKTGAAVHLIGKLPFELAAPAALSVLVLFNWYILSKRKIRDELRKSSGFILLSAFRAVRMLRSTDEAGKFSKSVIFFPYYMLLIFGRMLRVLGKEVKVGFLELLYVFGLRKFLK